MISVQEINIVKTSLARKKKKYILLSQFTSSWCHVILFIKRLSASVLESPPDIKSKSNLSFLSHTLHWLEREIQNPTAAIVSYQKKKSLLTEIYGSVPPNVMKEMRSSRKENCCKFHSSLADNFTFLSYCLKVLDNLMKTVKNKQCTGGKGKKRWSVAFRDCYENVAQCLLKSFTKKLQSASHLLPERWTGFSSVPVGPNNHQSGGDKSSFLPRFLLICCCC